ncbi:helix-turn-helix domain-containing protein [Microbacterium sp. A204]|uniref:helix-turn-helix domain-containing protein n=1 Tax=Microbacterium sp. A204 TaxID=3457321 RepID=UPI003FCF7D41
MAEESWAAIPNVLFRDEWSKAEVLTYIALLCSPWGHGGMVRVSQAHIAAGAGVTDRTVRKVIPKLVDRGAIRYGRPYEGVASYYYVNEIPREGGFFKLPRTWLWEAPLSTSGKILYLTLMSHRHRNTGKAFVSRTTLGYEAGMSNRTLGVAIEELIHIGLIVRQHQPRQGRRQGVNLYQIALPKSASFLVGNI